MIRFALMEKTGLYRWIRDLNQRCVYEASVDKGLVRIR